MAGRISLIVALAVMLCSCATTTVKPYVRPAPEHALPVQPEGVFYGLESEIQAAHGPDVSGFQILDHNEDGLRWRLALIDSASHSIDVQYYLWYGDDAGRMLAKRLLDAADRGVKVRVIVDDITTALGDASTLTLRDKVIAMVDAHPNIEIRLFNPWTNREILGRAGEFLTNLDQINQRMHNKAMIVDNRAVILGGRNIGNEYMGLNEDFNFRDLDVLGIGPVARQTSEAFDLYWNSVWVMPVSALEIPLTPEEQAEALSTLLKRVRDAHSLADFASEPQDWSSEIADIQDKLHFGTSKVYADRPNADGIDQVMIGLIRTMLATPRSELLVINAYIIPTDYAIEILGKLNGRGVVVKVLTNSLASTDVPAVISHFKQWRRPILESGAELFELRHDAQIKTAVCDTPPVESEYVGIHAKAMVVDRKRVYIGSMNFDPRSAAINTEMGVFIESPGLGESLAELIERDMQPTNAWRVELDGEQGLRWVDEEEVLTNQPTRYWWQHVEDALFMGFPKEFY